MMMLTWHDARQGLAACRINHLFQMCINSHKTPAANHGDLHFDDGVEQLRVTEHLTLACPKSNTCSIIAWH